jgi:hypothetical protein
MITRRDSLEHALAELEGHRLTGIATIVVSRHWWASLSVKEQEAYRQRADRAAVELRADEAISAHFVEMRGPGDGPPLSSERPI